MAVNKVLDSTSFSIEVENGTDKTGAKPDITQAEVTALMDTIVAKDVFLSKGGTLASKYGAQLTQRQTTKFDI